MCSSDLDAHHAHLAEHRFVQAQEFHPELDLEIPRQIHPQLDGSLLVDGSANLRELNRAFHWHLPENGPKTLNGLILEQLENIPDTGTSLRVGDYTIEIVQSAGQVVRNARIFPPASASPTAQAVHTEPPGN